MNHHPTKPELTQADFNAWPNCAVADCENKVTHDSDKCFPHTHGWEAVRVNLRERLADAEQAYKKNKNHQNVAEINLCRKKLEEIKDRR